ncbi:hypothetical protein ACIRD3_05535 [Kitasatospora sp. NPDC093550]|uniref:hypothetical protein n=1 Tax=Kitasatospora sp. NPDC093550 TaxID=3364089 RepID=UPI00381C8EAC
MTAVLVVAAGAGAYLLQTSDPDPAPVAAPPVPVTPAPTAPSPRTVPPPLDTPAAAPNDPASPIPLSVFPAQVQGYSLVSNVAFPACTGANTVAPSLAGMITQGHGCLGAGLALYRDAEGNQYNLALFTMKDQGDIPHLITFLASNPESFQVAVQLPSKDSGLSRLAAAGNRVQAFSGLGRALLVGQAQWSDGRVADFDELSAQLSPLTDAIIRNVPA